MSWKNVQYENGKFKTSSGGGGGASALADLDDVNITSATNGQVLKYDAQNDEWKNSNESGGGASALEDLTDVDLNNLSDNQPLRYNATSQKWVNGADNFPPLIYSDEEREIGVWRDGKPLYQKTINYGNVVTGQQQINISTGLTGIENIWVDTTMSQCDNGNYMYPLPNVHYGYDNLIGYFIDNTNNAPTLCIRAGNSMKNYILNLIVTYRYTKTTDTAGSGTWTIQGGYAHHYSTTEHVVGTWIDGKPLYQKTINFGALPNSTTKSVSHGVSNADFINVTNAFAYYPNAQYNAMLPTISLYNVGNGVAISVTDTTIDISTAINYSGYTNCYVTIQYTKTTDT